MKLLKDYESSSLTLKRVREVIDRALDELEYDSRFDVNVAARTPIITWHTPPVGTRTWPHSKPSWTTAAVLTTVPGR